MGSHHDQKALSNPSEINVLPATVSVPAAARLLRVSRSAAYRAVTARAAGDESQWPTPVIRVGASIRIPTAALLDALGIPVHDVLELLAEPSSSGATDHAPAA